MANRKLKTDKSCKSQDHMFSDLDKLKSRRINHIKKLLKNQKEHAHGFLYSTDKL